MQQSTLTLYVDHTLLVEGECSQTRPMSGHDIRIRVEIPNNHDISRRAQFTNGAGENPIIRKGILSARKGGDEEIVESHMKV